MDAVAADESVLAEIFARQGKLKPGQQKKVALDAFIDIKDVLSIGLSVHFPTLIGFFGPLVGVILVAYTLGAITGGWLVHRHPSATR